MSKFCENCGAEMDDNQTICPSCGTGVGTEAEYTNPVKEEPAAQPTYEDTTTTSSPKSGNGKNIGIIAGVVAVIAIIVAIIFSIFGKGYLKPIDNYFKGIQKADAKTYVKSSPAFVDADEDDYEDYLEERLDDLEDTYGEKVKITYKVKKKEKIKKGDLQDIQDYIEEEYDEEVKVSAGYELKLAVTFKGKKKEKTSTDKYYVYKIDGKWCFFNVSPKTAGSYLDKNK